MRSHHVTTASPASTQCIPSLKIEDISREASKVPTAIAEEQGATVLRHDLFTNNVLYAEVAFDMRALPSNLVPLVPLFCRCLTQMGTETESFVELTERIGRKTGGISVSPFVSDIKGTEEPAAYVIVRGKAMADKASELTGERRLCAVCLCDAVQPWQRHAVVFGEEGASAGAMGNS